MKQKITVSRDHLFATLSKAIIFTKKKPVLPVEGLFKFSVQPGLDNDHRLVVAAYNGQSYIECACPCRVQGEPLSVFLVNAEEIFSLIKISVESDIDISLKSTSARRLAIFDSGSRSSHKFPAYPDDMPIPNSSQSIFAMEISGADLHAVSNTVANLVDDSEGNLQVMGMGVCLEYIKERNSLFFWGGSSHRLGGYEIPMKEPENFQKFIVTKQTVEDMDVLFKGNETVKLHFRGNICEITGEDVYIKTKVVDHKYMDIYNLVLKKLKDHETVVDFSVSELRLSVDKLMIHADKTFQGVTMDFNDRSAVMKIDNIDQAKEGLEEVPYAGAEKNAEAHIGVALTSMKQVLKQTISDRVTFSILSGNGRPNPVLVSSAKGDRSILFMLGQYQQSKQ